MKQNSEVWFRTDLPLDVVSSLSLCSLCLKNVERDESLWKWVFLSLHSAWQGAMVCHQTGTAGIGALSKKSANAHLEWHENDRKGIASDFPEDYLAAPPELFKRLVGEARRIEHAGSGLESFARHKPQFERLNALRMKFVHFKPVSWSIELSGLPDIALSTADLIKAIADANWGFRHLGESDRSRLLSLLQEIQAWAKDTPESIYQD